MLFCWLSQMRMFKTWLLNKAGMLVSMQPTYPHVDVQTVMTEIIIIVFKKGKVEGFVFL